MTQKRNKSLKRDYRYPSGHKLTDGYGSWHCPCCNPFGCSPRKMKKKARRIVRRMVKQEIRRMFE